MHKDGTCNDGYDSAPLADDIEFQVRRECPDCGGSGCCPVPPADEITQCGVCRAWWRRAQAHIGLVWTTLPCSHEYRNREVTWQPPDCETCGGDGYRYRWFTLGDWLDWLLSQIVFEDTRDVRDTSAVADVSQQATARRRAV